MTKPTVTDEMVNRFLSWRLPSSFNPDCGISFKRTYNESSPYGPAEHEPTGTNLLDAAQARAMLEHVLGGCTQAPAATEAPSKPFAYYIHIAAEQRGEFVHDLDEALDDLTNCECKITELFDHAPPVAECPYCHACWPECLHCDGTGRAVQAPSLREVCAALLSLIRRDAPHLSGKVLGEAEAALAAVGASVQPVLASLSDEQRLRSALDRLAANFRLLLAGKPVRDVTETLGEVDAALASSTPTTPTKAE